MEQQNNSEAIRNKVCECIADVMTVDVDKVKRLKDTDVFVNELRADSLDIVEIIMKIEENFDVEISDEDASKLTTLGEIDAYLTEKKAKIKEG